MSANPEKPTRLQLFLWLLPLMISIAMTIVFLFNRQGIEIGLGAILASVLYFIIRYGASRQDSPPQ